MLLHLLDSRHVSSPGRLLRVPVVYTAPIGWLLPPVLVSWTALTLAACIPFLSVDAVSSTTFVMICHIMRHDMWEDINLINRHSVHSSVNTF